MRADTEAFSVISNRYKIQGATQLHGLAASPHQGLTFGETVGIFNTEFVAHHGGIKTFSSMQVQLAPIQVHFPTAAGRLAIGNRFNNRSHNLSVVLHGVIPRHRVGTYSVENQVVSGSNNANPEEQDKQCDQTKLLHNVITLKSELIACPDRRRPGSFLNGCRYTRVWFSAKANSVIA